MARFISMDHILGVLPESGDKFTEDEQNALLRLGFTILTQDGKDEGRVPFRVWRRSEDVSEAREFCESVWDRLEDGLKQWIPVMVTVVPYSEDFLAKIADTGELTVIPRTDGDPVFGKDTVKDLNEVDFFVTVSADGRSETAHLLLGDRFRNFKKGIK